MHDLNPFAQALGTVPLPRLRAAFDAVQDTNGRSYNRTTLNRWLQGSIPTRGEFIQSLASKLDAPAIYEAWQEARDSRAPSSAQAAVRAFGRLERRSREQAFHQIRDVYLSSLPVRSRMIYRVDVHDPPERCHPGEPNDHLLVTVSASWSGEIPADATAVFTADRGELDQAFESQQCVFREGLRFDPDRLHPLLERHAELVLAVNPPGTTGRGAIYVGEAVQPGVYCFNNPLFAEAKIRVSLTYPFPRGQSVFFLRFGPYRLQDTAEITLTLNSESSSDPRAFAYLPPGRQDELSVDLLRSNEMFVSLGHAGTVLSEGDGAVLYWTEH